jgi:hypothetical protein
VSGVRFVPDAAALYKVRCPNCYDGHSESKCRRRLKQATGSYTAPMQAIWTILIVGVVAHLLLVREPRFQPVAAVAV